jgi:hypothetical protein
MKYQPLTHFTHERRITMGDVLSSVLEPRSGSDIQVVAYMDDNFKEWGDTQIFPGDSFTEVIKWADERLGWAKRFRATADDWNFFEEGIPHLGQIQWNRIPIPAEVRW